MISLNDYLYDGSPFLINRELILFIFEKAIILVMSMDYTWFYVESNIVSIILFLMMFLKVVVSVGRQSKQVIFINIIIAHISYFLSDICWALILGGYLPPAFPLVALVNILNAVILSAITGFWFVYVELSQGEGYIKEFRMRILMLIPVVISAVVMIVLFVFFPDTVLVGDRILTLTYFIVFLSVPVFYIIISTIRSLIRAFKKENYAVKGLYLTDAVYPVILSVFGVVQTLWLTIPMFCFGCAVMMLYVYITSLNDQVSIDELTKLNNRTQLKKYIASEVPKQVSAINDRYVLMIDLNKFKQINDLHGHVEGDFALRRAADAMKRACAECSFKTFIARYGGDEFIIIAKTSDEELIKKLCGSIKDNLVRMNTEAGSSYELTASIGYAGYSGDIDGFQKALCAADEALYKEKAAR